MGMGLIMVLATLFGAPENGVQWAILGITVDLAALLCIWVLSKMYPNKVTILTWFGKPWDD